MAGFAKGLSKDGIEILTSKELGNIPKTDELNYAEEKARFAAHNESPVFSPH